MSKIFLSFDVEEFDMPLEYGQNISLQEQLTVGKNGLDEVINLLQQQNVVCTHFTTANFAQHYPTEIINLSDGGHEIASHTFYHSQFKIEDLRLSKKALEAITHKPVLGLRMPRMRKVEMKDVLEAGYKYDSSINPTWLPGRYNNLHLSRTFYTQENMLRLPASVSPMFRLPLFWLGFKNYPYKLFLHLCKRTLKKDGYICLYFHPWEFVNIDEYKMPNYTKKPNGKKLLLRLQNLITDLKNEGEFCTIESFTKRVK